MMRGSSWLLAAAIGCGTSPRTFPAARFANAPPATVVDDRRDVARPPHRRLDLASPYSYDTMYERRVTHALEVPRHRRALGVNSLDEVPDSTWFTNRRDLTPEQIRTGPVTLDNPELHLPWTVLSTKFGGAAPGFIVRDSRGIKYVLKFDDPEHPELETGTDVVVDRLMWAAGFNVAEDQIAYFRPDQLVVAPGAKIEDVLGQDRGTLTRAGVDQRLAKAAHEPDGRIRTMASRWIEGKPLGGALPEGVRRDDRNDRIPHERRRDLRGMYAIYSWLDMVDVWSGNYLDVWTADPRDPNIHYVKHYAVDFGLSLGAMAEKMHDLRRGYVSRLDWPTMFASLFTLGLIQWSWETRPHDPPIRGVSPLFTAGGFDPGGWQPDFPYQPFLDKDRFDAYWGAKIVARFTPAQLRAAVEAGRFSDPAAADYLTATLVARQRAIASYWYARVNPLDRFAIDGGELCFDDLAIVQGYAPGGPATRYVVTPHDAAGSAIGAMVPMTAGPGGHTCLNLPPLAGGGEGYTIFELTTVRPAFRGSTYVHVARDPRGAAHVIGIWRI